MKKFIIVFFLILHSCFLSVEKIFADNSSLPLLNQGDLQYLGAFRVPNGIYGTPGSELSLNKGGYALTYHSDINGEGLFIARNRQNPDWPMVGEITIPTPVDSSTLSALPRATIKQSFYDITNGNLGSGTANIGVGGSAYTGDNTFYGGLLSKNSALYGTLYGIYDSSSKAYLTHFKTSTDFASFSTDYKGLFKVGATPDVPQAGYVDGYMSWIPKQWQADFGGTALTGNSGLSIANRTGYGPTAFVFDPAAIGTQDSIPAIPIVRYDSSPSSHQLVDGNGIANPYYNGTTKIMAVVFPSNSRSIIFFGKHGEGDAGLVYCYGQATTNPALNRTCVDPNATYDPAIAKCTGGSNPDPYCYDLDNLSKGGHAYPYNYYAWAYDAKDLLNVKNHAAIEQNPSPNAINVQGTPGETYQPWNIKPYAVWTINFPFPKSSNQEQNIVGATYDASTQRLFLAQAGADGVLPIIHVYHLNLPNSSEQTYNFFDFSDLTFQWFHQGKGLDFDADFNNNVNTKDLGIMMSKWN